MDWNQDEVDSTVVKVLTVVSLIGFRFMVGLGVQEAAQVGGTMLFW